MDTDQAGGWPNLFASIHATRGFLSAGAGGTAVRFRAGRTQEEREQVAINPRPT